MVRQGLYPQVTLDSDWLSREVNRLLAEDLSGGDVTTDAMVNPDVEATAQIEAAAELILAGAIAIPPLFEGYCEADLRVSDGQQVAAGEIIGTLAGPAHHILSRERAMLNLLQHLSGIATLTRTFVEKAAPFGVEILDTRKTIPGLRKFEKYAVACGGGTNHRLDLSAGILVKDNHLAVAGGMSEVVDRLRRSCPDMAVEVEAETRSQVEAGLEAGVGAFLLDNMPVDEVRACVVFIREYPGGEDIFIEASGGINPDNVEVYAQTGVDGLSVGYLTHSAPFVDIRLELVS
jgi:nicotinate-nucleotide pyrophosphorylase (carboxylating)